MIRTLGDHVLSRGDCLEVMAGLPDGSVKTRSTDPPYGTTACKWDSVIPFDLMWAQLKRIIKPNEAIVLTASQPFTSALIMSNIKMLKYCWVWEKSKGTGHALCKKRPLKAHEDVVVFSPAVEFYEPQMTVGSPYNSKLGKKESAEFSTGAVRYDNKGARYPRSVQYFKTSESEKGSSRHPTQKPVALMEYMIKTYTHPGETVLDFTMGSGTTGVACVNTGRKFIGIEKDSPDKKDYYFNVSCGRILEAMIALGDAAGPC